MAQAVSLLEPDAHLHIYKFATWRFGCWGFTVHVVEVFLSCSLLRNSSIFPFLTIQRKIFSGITSVDKDHGGQKPAYCTSKISSYTFWLYLLWTLLSFTDIPTCTGLPRCLSQEALCWVTQSHCSDSNFRSWWTRSFNSPRPKTLRFYFP